ncbi:MAG: hypothetical protein IK102_04845 [Treponema sp.]|nr:hypothetical protein [Treponema sp.]
MDRRRNRKRSNWNNQKNGQQKNSVQNPNQNQNQGSDQKQKTFHFNHTLYQNEVSRQERQKAIQELKAREIVCPMCGQPLTDLASSLTAKDGVSPVHFECALKEVESKETLGEKEKIAYIGQGRFGVLYFENPRDQRKFTIKKIIEWEDREKKSEWRNELSGLYSQID